MTTSDGNAVPKVHPATRAVEPDDPMNLHGVEVPGDTDLMFRVLVEEYCRMGMDAESLMAMFRDPFYQGPHGLWTLLGERETRRRIDEIVSRCGVFRTETHEAPPQDKLVELDLPHARDGRI